MGRDDMPNYNSNLPLFALYPGDSITVFNNENPTPPQASQQVAIGNVYGEDDAGVSVLISYPGGAPTTVTINVQMADTDVDSAYGTVATSNSLTGDSLNVNARHKFIRVQKAVQTGGGAMTAVIAR
jgi:hypothetical protein